jgi:hypothetical protein
MVSGVRTAESSRIWSGRWKSNPRPKLGKLEFSTQQRWNGAFFALFEFLKKVMEKIRAVGEAIYLETRVAVSVPN